jgi:hypothetical protein
MSEKTDQQIAWEAAFSVWKTKVNNHCRQLCGLDADDLDDQPYADWFDDGIEPFVAARRAIRNTSQG